MINYLKFLLIFIVFEHISDFQSAHTLDMGAQLSDVGSDIDTMFEPQAGSRKMKPLQIKKGINLGDKKPLAPPTKPPITTPKPTPGPPAAAPEAPEKQMAPEIPELHALDDEDVTTELPEVVTDVDGQEVLRKSDLEFLEGIYRGNDRETYKKMADKIYKALEDNYKQVYEKNKDNQLLKAFIKDSKSVSEGIREAHSKMKKQELPKFLHDWYKTEYKPKKGEIKEVEKAIKKQEESKVTIPPQDPAADEKKKKGKKPKKGKKKVPKKPGAKNFSGTGDEVDVDEDALELNKGAKDVGVEHYSKENLLKDLVDENKGKKADKKQ